MIVMTCVNDYKWYCLVLTREGPVDAFGTFQRQLKLSLSKMRAKFIDHCNQMSGRKWKQVLKWG